MANVLVMKGEDGKLQGFGQAGQKTYNRFLAAVRQLEPGELLKFTYKVPRSLKFHRRHFVMLATIYESQDRYTNELHFRKWGEVGAGHCDMVPGAGGELFAVPRSIDYESLDDAEFSDVHLSIKDFHRSEHARRFLWPHLTDTQTYEMMDMLLMGFEQ